MCNKCPKAISLDTLANACTEFVTACVSEPKISLKNTTQYEDKKTLRKRAKRKYLSRGLSTALINYCEKNSEKAELLKSYRNTFHCAEELVEKDGKVTTEYCKNRWCLVCNAIRQAVLQNQYSPVLENWEEKHFVTLTVPNCKGEDLKETIKEMCATFGRINQMFYRRWKRGKGAKFVGLRKLECTYNPHRDDFHPHFHVIVDSKEMGEDLLNEWLSRNPTCDRKAQDIRQADENSSKELFKYFTKIITSKDKEKRIYVGALNTIFRAIRGMKTFQPFGFKLSDFITEETENEAIEEEEEESNENTFPQFFSWDQEIADWVNKETGELLSGHILSESLQEITKKKMILNSS